MLNYHKYIYETFERSLKEAYSLISREMVWMILPSVNLVSPYMVHPCVNLASHYIVPHSGNLASC